ncbi:MAG: hypothetical protein AAF514_10055 [Verrucomicrobiota bacterium]
MTSSPEEGHPVASHNGDFVGVTGEGGQACLWGRATPTPLSFTSTETCLAVFNDGRILTRSTRTGQLTCWDVPLISDPDPEEPPRLGRPDERWVLELNTGRRARIVHTSISPDERWVACLMTDRIFHIDMKERRVRVSPVEEGSWKAATKSIAISRDGQQMAVAGLKGGEAWLYRPCPGKEQGLSRETIRKLEPETESRVTACCFSQDGERLFLGDEDGRVRVLRLKGKRQRSDESWMAQSFPITALAVSQGGDLLAVAGGSSMTLWSTDHPPRLRIQLDTGPGARNWLQFCGQDTLLMHTAPNRPIEVLEAPESS